MHNMTKSQATTPISVQLSGPEFIAFIFPHLSMPRRGSKCKLGYHRVFNLILWVLYTGMQWKCMPVPRANDGTALIHYTGREARPGLRPGPAKGTALGTSLVGVCAASSVSSLHPVFGRPEGVTRLAMCILHGRAGWSGVEPQAQETGHGTAYTICRQLD